MDIGALILPEFFVDLVVSAVIDSVVAADAILAVVEAVGIVVSAVVDVLPVVYETVVPVEFININFIVK